ncbi:Hypothetical protein HVR_LOCUS565 [uncultured virus]|nr:Hypothetical protein HVR_LOCUS565 [uncultured virus]
MSRARLLSLLGEEWNEILNGLDENMSFVLTDLSHSEISKMSINSDINAWLKSMIQINDPDIIDKYQAALSISCCPNDDPNINSHLHHMFYHDITEIIWEICKTKNYRDRSRFLCRMKDERYGFFICSCGSCGYGSCSVGGSYAEFYIGSFPEIYRLAMNNKDRRYHESVTKINKEHQTLYQNQ